MKMTEFADLALEEANWMEYEVQYADDPNGGFKSIMVAARDEDEAYEIAGGIFFEKSFDYQYISVLCPFTGEVLT